MSAFGGKAEKESRTAARGAVACIGDYVDILQKVLIGIGAVLAGAYFAVIKESFDESAKCAEAKQSILQFVSGKAFDFEMSLRLVNRWIPRECSDDDSQNFLVRLVNRWIPLEHSDDDLQNVRSRWVEDVVATSNWPPSRQVETPQATPPVTPGPPPEVPQVSKQGWVAVGFANSNDFNFVDRNGQNITGVPSKETVIKAKWPVNVRKGAADWKPPVAMLNQGECFVIKETKPLPAGGQLQIWASGEAKPCDKASLMIIRFRG